MEMFKWVPLSLLVITLIFVALPFIATAFPVIFGIGFLIWIGSYSDKPKNNERR